MLNPSSPARMTFLNRLSNGLVCVGALVVCLSCIQRSAAQSAVSTEHSAAAGDVTSGGTEKFDYYQISTELGSMVIRLSNKTPLHRDNFKKLVAEKVLDGTTFHRIIEGFMIQGGDPWSKDDNPANDGNGSPGYSIPAEFDSTLFHTYGAVAAARQPDQVNPAKESNGSQFYIVQGRPFGEAQLYQMQTMKARQKPGFHYPDSIRAIYVNKGGAPQLDGDYTVFGHLVEGFDVLAKIAAAPTLRKQGVANQRGIDQPFTPIPMIVTALPEYVPKQHAATPADSTNQYR